MIGVEYKTWVEEELYPGEKLLWVGKPTPLRIVMQYAHTENVITTLIAAVLFGSALFTCAYFGLDTISIANLQIPVLSLFFIPLAGLCIYLGYSYWRATQIVYAVTSRRALIVKRTIDGKDVVAYNVIAYLERRDLSGGKGDLIFASEKYSPLMPTNYYAEGNYNVRIRKIGFFGIDNVREVEQLMYQTFTGATHTKSL